MTESTLRARPQAANKESANSDAANRDSAHQPRANAGERSSGVGVLDILRVIAGVLLLSSVVSYFVKGNIWWDKRPTWAQYKQLVHKWKGDRYMTLDELSTYDGTNNLLPIYVAVNGVIYDVSASPQFYGPGGGYHIFAGRDATRSFVTGCFQEDGDSDMRGVEEMYMPKDLDLPPKLDDGATEAEKKAARKLWKIRRDRASREGKATAKKIVDSWQQRYEGGMGGKYFRVGKVKLADDWKEKRGPIKALCKRAVDQRPDTNKWSTWDGDDDHLP